MKMKSLIKRFLCTIGIELRRYDPEFSDRCVTLRPSNGAPRGNVLIAYILDPFLLQPGQQISTAHTHHAESVLIAQAFLDLGYRVDIIDYHNRHFLPRTQYDFFVSARMHLETIAARLNHDCLKIAHLDTAHFLFNNAATYKRALALQQRRGFTCTSLRVFEHNLAIEHCDYAAVLGGEFCMSTYQYAGKPMYRLPVPTQRTYPLNPNKDFAKYHDQFLWFGSTGLVHKGLDLALETFAQSPNLHLTVGGRLDREKEFCRLYHTELYATSNIHAVGWIDVDSDKFIDLSNRLLAVVFPSCSESESCSVLTCMQAGLIPVVTRESGIDVQDFGVLLPEATVEAVRDSVEKLASLPADQLKEMSRKSWEYARENHSAEKYTEAYRAMISQILEIKASAN
jgi:glycosyltransferase involved in cell wall biosynthesis